MGLFSRAYERQRRKAYDAFIERGCTADQAELAVMALHPLASFRPSNRDLESVLRSDSRAFASYIRNRSPAEIEDAARISVTAAFCAVTAAANWDYAVDWDYVERFGLALGVTTDELEARATAGTLDELADELKSNLNLTDH